MKLPSHIIHTPEFINCNKLTKTKLPNGHTRQERISEIKQLADKYQDVPGMFLYASNKLDQLNGFSDEFYQQWVKGLQELEEKGVSSVTVPGDELPKDVHGNKVDLNTHLEVTVRTLLNNPSITITDKEFGLFMHVVRRLEGTQNPFEMGIAYVTCMAFDKEKFIIDRNIRIQDFTELCNVFVYVHRNKTEAKSFLLLITEAFGKYHTPKDIQSLILGSEGYTLMRNLIRPTGDTFIMNEQQKGIANTIPSASELPIDVEGNSPDILIGNRLVAGSGEIDPTKKINLDLEKFIHYILDPKNAENVEGYISKRSVTDKDLELTMGYLNGAAFIMGLVYDHLVVIRFNIYNNPTAFHVKLDGVDMPLPITVNNLVHFLTHGKFLKGTLLK